MHIPAEGNTLTVVWIKSTELLVDYDRHKILASHNICRPEVAMGKDRTWFGRWHKAAQKLEIWQVRYAQGSRCRECFKFMWGGDDLSAFFGEKLNLPGRLSIDATNQLTLVSSQFPEAGEDFIQPILNAQLIDVRKAKAGSTIPCQD